MIRETITPLVLATLVVLAGCSGAITNPTAPASDGETGTVNFYISDERNAIDQFDHLNVTITKVGFQQADADDDGDDEANETDDDETETTTTVQTTANTSTTTTSTTAEMENETEANETDDDSDTPDADDADDESEEDDDEREGWITRNVSNVTIDLTEYQGANATLLEQFEIPNGTYTKTFVYISDINATLTSGEQVNVKLPSEKLHINKDFTVGNGESVDFVFDITVFKAGNSGKYILKPVVSQSGTDVPIETDDDDSDDSDDEGPPEDVDTPEQDDEDAAALNASFLSEVTAGENVTIAVTQNGSAVSGAQVFVDDERIGETNANGELTVTVPEDDEEFEVTIKYRGSEVELETELNTTTTAA